MQIESIWLPDWLIILSFVFSLALMALGFFNANWHALKRHSRAQHLFFFCCYALAAIWSIRAGLLDGLTIHFYAITAVTLLMGWPLALIACSAALVVITAFGLESWALFGVNYLLKVALPIFSSVAALRFIERSLPHNPFIYIFLGAFFNGALAIAMIVFANAILIGLLGALPWHIIISDYVAYLPLMLFPEAFINGVLIAILVGFHPQWLSTFDQDKYFKD